MIPKKYSHTGLTKLEGILQVGSAFPDPPFEVEGEKLGGFDMDLIQAIAKELGLTVEIHRYEGADFNGIFNGLETGAYDVVISGATVNEQRKQLVHFCSPYLKSGQSLVVSIDHQPAIRSIEDLKGAIIGVQLGNTSEPIARQLHRIGKVADIKIYAYNQIINALDDIVAGHITAFMKLEPVMRWLIQNYPQLKIVQTGITEERLAIAVGRSNDKLAEAIETAQQVISRRGDVKSIGKKWLKSSDPKATKVLL